MLKATPGPWEWVAQGGGDYYYLIGDGGTRVLDDGSACGEYAPAIEPATDPDAHLIAAAPDLYAALDAIVKYPDPKSGTDIWIRARAALAKAQGEAV